MDQLLISVVVSFLIVYYAVPVAILVAKKKKLFDLPDDDRKLHDSPTPSLGGVAIFLGVLVSLTISERVWKGAPEFSNYVASMAILFFLGLKDDILTISAWKKLLGQLIVGFILIFKAKLLIASMHGFLGVQALPTEFSFLLTLFTIVVIVNGFNLIDGVDGLAASVAIIIASAFGFYFIVDGQLPYAILAFSLVAALLAFLIFNFQPAKIFMGDSGSMLIGLIIAILSIRFIITSPFSATYPISASPALGFGFMALPLLDCLRVFFIRMTHGRSPFSPDRNHIHHLLLDRGFSHKGVTLFSIFISILFVALSFYSSAFGTTASILIIIASFFLYVSILFFTRPRSAENTLRAVKQEEMRSAS